MPLVKSLEIKQIEAPQKKKHDGNGDAKHRCVPFFKKGYQRKIQKKTPPPPRDTYICPFFPFMSSEAFSLFFFGFVQIRRRLTNKASYC